MSQCQIVSVDGFVYYFSLSCKAESKFRIPCFCCFLLQIMGQVTVIVHRVDEACQLGFVM